MKMYGLFMGVLGDRLWWEYSQRGINLSTVNMHTSKSIQIIPSKLYIFTAAPNLFP